MVSRRWYGPAIIAAAGCFLAVAGCGGDKPHTNPRGSAASPSLSSRQLAEANAITAYKGMWSAFVQAGNTSNAEDPALDRYISGEALTTITKALAADRQAGKVTKGQVRTSPIVTAATPANAPTEVDIRDCLDDTQWLEYWKSGGLVDNTPGGKHRVTAVVKATQGKGWTVTAFALQGVGTCP